jgi:hypothetical protein
MGKASVLLVLGYSALLLMSGLLMSDMSVQAYDNAMTYYDQETARNIAISGANMAANQLFQYPPMINGNPWFNGYTTPVSFNGGSFVVTIDSTTSLDPISGERRMTLTSVATYRDSTATVIAILRPSNFAKFAMYAGAAGSAVYWATYDSIFGPTHVEGTLRTHGTPYFGGKVTVKNNVDSTSWSGHPIFNAGVETGVSIPLNKDYSKLREKASSGGKTFTGNDDLYLHFKGDSITYKRAAAGPDTTVLASALAPNGAIVLNNSAGKLHVQGLVKGRFTVGAIDTQSTSRGKVVIDDNITYNTDPRTTPGSTDMLGIVANQSITIADNTASGHGPNFTVMAALFSYASSVDVENRDTRNLGTLFTYGGWTVNDIFATTNSGITKGLKVNLRFDERFRTSAPPFFPTTKAYEILAWYE